MTFHDERKAVGKEGLIRVNGLEISVIVRDIRIRAQVVDLLVEPTAGTGMVWVDSGRLRIV